MARWILLNWPRWNVWLKMLIAGYIKKDFIQETLKQNTTEDLRAFLSIFKSIPYVILLKILIAISVKF